MAWWSADIQGRRRPVLQPSSRMFVALQAAASSEGVVPAFKAAQAPRTQPWPSRGLWPSPSEVRRSDEPRRSRSRWAAAARRRSGSGRCAGGLRGENSDVELACRYLIWTTSNRKRTPLAVAAEGGPGRKQFCAFYACARFRTAKTLSRRSNIAAQHHSAATQDRLTCSTSAGSAAPVSK